MIGINQSNLIQLDPADLDKVCKGITALGATHVRFAADWAQLSNFLGTLNLDPLRRVADALAQYNLTPLPVIGVHAPWRHSLNAFADFTAEVVDEFGRIPAYEVWNEPNLSAFYSDGPATFLGILRAAASTIRANGVSKVIHGGLAAFPTWQFLWVHNYSPSAWLSALYNAKEKNDYDLLGYHPYSLTAGGQWANPATKPFGIAELDAMDAVRAQHGDTRPYAFTELGYDTAKVSVADAAKYLAQQVVALQGRADVWLFTYRDTNGDGGNYGMVDAQNAQKPTLYNTAQGLFLH